MALFFLILLGQITYPDTFEGWQWAGLWLLSAADQLVNWGRRHGGPS